MNQSLLQLHKLVKEHPFRVNNDKIYLVNYMNCLSKFIHAFWNVYKYDKNNKQLCGLDNMVHDLNKTIYKVKTNKDYTPVQLRYLEAGLTCHHYYMEYNSCPIFYTLDNKDIYAYTWNERYNKYFLKLYDKEQYVKNIENFKKMWKDADNKDIEEVVEEYCNEMQFIYDHYDELFGDDIQNIGKENN